MRDTAGTPAPQGELWPVLRQIAWVYERVAPVAKLGAIVIFWLFLLYVFWVACVILILGLVDIFG